MDCDSGNDKSAPGAQVDKEASSILRMPASDPLAAAARRMLGTRAMAWQLKRLPVPQKKMPMVFSHANPVICFTFRALQRTGLTADPCRVGECNAEVSLKLRR